MPRAFRFAGKMPFVKVASLAQLPAGTVMEVTVSGNPYAVCNAGGNVTALDGLCPHQQGPLGQGEISGHNVVCPWHAWEWDCATGANDFDPNKKVAMFAVRVEGGDILIDVPA
jgi:nitrite reductase (NADH) small subunit